MNDMMDMNQYTSALGISSFAQQIAETKAALSDQKKAVLGPIGELGLGISGTTGIEGVASTIKNVVLQKAKDAIASRLESSGVPKDVIDKVMSGDVKGGFESALAKAKEFVAEKGGQLKDQALSKVEDLKDQASDAVDSVKGQVSDAVDAVKKQASDALDQAQSEIADRMATARQMAEDGVEDGFPEGESLLPQGAGADLRVSGTSVETVPEPETAAFGDTSSSISQSGNIMETSFGQTPPEDFAAATGEVSADDALSSLAKTASSVGESLGQTAAEAGTAVSGAVAAGTQAAVAAGTEAASGIADTVLAGLGAVADVALGPVGILVGIGASLAAVFEADKAPKALPDILNPSSQFGA
jgi:hypothetical protein